MTHARAVWAETLLHHIVERSLTGLLIAQRCGTFPFDMTHNKLGLLLVTLDIGNYDCDIVVRRNEIGVSPLSDPICCLLMLLKFSKGSGPYMVIIPLCRPSVHD